jgi:hypothetical protein
MRFVRKWSKSIDIDIGIFIALNLKVYKKYSTRAMLTSVILKLGSFFQVLNKQLSLAQIYIQQNEMSGAQSRQTPQSNTNINANPPASGK